MSLEEAGDWQYVFEGPVSSPILSWFHLISSYHETSKSSSTGSCRHIVQPHLGLKPWSQSTRAEAETSGKTGKRSFLPMNCFGCLSQRLKGKWHHCLILSWYICYIFIFKKNPLVALISLSRWTWMWKTSYESHRSGVLKINFLSVFSYIHRSPSACFRGGCSIPVCSSVGQAFSCGIIFQGHHMIPSELFHAVWVFSKIQSTYLATLV